MTTKQIILLIAAVVFLVYFYQFFVHRYVSSPGFTTMEWAQEFYRTKPVCRGLDIPIYTEDELVDAPGQSVCLGYLRPQK